MSGKGQAKTGGRRAGTPNKISELVRNKLDELEVDPVERLVTIAKEAHENNDLHLAGNLYKELAAYIAPKVKSITIVDKSDLESLLDDL